MKRYIQYTLFFCISTAGLLAGNKPMGYDVMSALEELQILLETESIDPNCQDEQGLTPLHLIASGRLDRAVKLLKGSPSFYSTTRLNLQGSHADTWISPIEDTLLFDLYKQGGHEFKHSGTQRSKHVASLDQSPENHSHLVSLLAYATVQLIEAGADVNASTLKGLNTPLHLSVQQPGFDQLVAILLVTGANTESENHFGLKPLHLATLGRAPEMVGMLLEIGADPKHTTPSGYTSLDLASAHPSLLLNLHDRSPSNLEEDRAQAKKTRDTLLAHSSTQDLECYFCPTQKESGLTYYETPEPLTFSEWIVSSPLAIPSALQTYAADTLNYSLKTAMWIDDAMYHVPSAVGIGAILYFSVHAEQMQKKRQIIAALAPAALPEEARTELRQFLGRYTFNQLKDLCRLPGIERTTTLFRAFITASLPDINQELLRPILEGLSLQQLTGLGLLPWAEREATVLGIIEEIRGAFVDVVMERVNLINQMQGAFQQLRIGSYPAQLLQEILEQLTNAASANTAAAAA